MRKRALGSTMIGEIGLGTAGLALRGRPDERTALATVRAALEAGITLLDTADAYCIEERDFGYGERLVAQAVAECGALGSRAVVATKGGHLRHGLQISVDCRPERLKAAARESALRLGVAEIDLYLIHWPDPAVPYADSVGALADLLDDGVIRAAGVSNVTPDLLSVAVDVLGDRLTAVQNELSVLSPGYLQMARYCAARGIAFMAYQPLGGKATARDLADSPTATAATLTAVAARHCVSPQQVALAWLLAMSPNIIPLPGSRRPATITASAAASGLRLADEDLADLSRPGSIDIC